MPARRCRFGIPAQGKERKRPNLMDHRVFWRELERSIEAGKRGGIVTGLELRKRLIHGGIGG